MSDHETTLEKLRDSHREGVAFFRDKPGQMQQEMARRNEMAVDALEAALAALRRTCGTCEYLERMGPAGARCRLYGGQRDDDDGCIKGWLPKEVSRG